MNCTTVNVPFQGFTDQRSAGREADWGFLGGNHGAAGPRTAVGAFTIEGDDELSDDSSSVGCLTRPENASTSRLELIDGFWWNWTCNTTPIRRQILLLMD